MKKSCTLRQVQGLRLAMGLSFAMGLSTQVDANTTQINQLLQVCKADSRKTPSVACTDCHTSSSGTKLNERGQFFKDNYRRDDEAIRTTFCPDKAPGPLVREPPVLMVATPLNLTAGTRGTATFSATDPQGVKLKLTVTKLPTGAKFTQTGGTGGTTSGVLTFTPKTTQVGTYTVTVTARQQTGTPKLQTSTTVQLIVSKP